MENVAETRKNRHRKFRVGSFFVLLREFEVSVSYY